MFEPTYEKVFEAIRSSLVPKSQFDESQKEISILRSQLETAKNDAKKLKSEYDDQNLTIGILRAEKQTLENEKKTFESKFEEVSLKLTRKTHEYNSLLQTTQADCNPKIIEKVSTRNQSVKQEPHAIGIVNDPASSTSRSDEPVMKTRSKREITARDDEKRTSAKRRKTSKTAQATKQSTEVQQIFSCDLCLYDWGSGVHRLNDEGVPEGVPDPKTSIRTFSTFKEYKDHYFIVHDEYSREQIDNGCYETDEFCQEKSCLESFPYGIKPAHHWPHGDINCEVCGLSFKFKRHRDIHIKLEHANINLMSKKEILKLYEFSLANV